MEFSSNILIDFGLNLAGYLVAALLIYVIAGRVNRAVSAETPAETISEEMPAKANPRPSKNVAQNPKSAPEFIPLTEREKISPASIRNSAGDQPSSSPVDDSDGTDWRRRNRRAIYEEARRLLAGGASRTDLLSRLPVTESELDMLTVAGKA